MKPWRSWRPYMLLNNVNKNAMIAKNANLPYPSSASLVSPYQTRPPIVKHHWENRAMSAVTCPGLSTNLP